MPLVPEVDDCHNDNNHQDGDHYETDDDSNYGTTGQASGRGNSCGGRLSGGGGDKALEAWSRETLVHIGITVILCLKGNNMNL